MDVDRDGLPDIICGVGAGAGLGVGYTELYMTQPNGTLSLLAAPSPHGLQKYPTSRNRVAVTLRNKQGVKEYVFMGTQGKKRADGGSNLHRVFRNVYSAPGVFPYFVEVRGPWAAAGLFDASCAAAGDFTGDGRDDLVVCNAGGPALLAAQRPGHAFARVPLLPAKNPYIQQWKKARLADATGDGRLDLVVITWANALRVFRGRAASPYFDFSAPYYQRALPATANDVEVLDVNRDGRPDLYVVLVNAAKGQFCSKRGRVVNLPANVTPPADAARDLLLVGNGARRPAAARFTPVAMQHAMPGCGSVAERWDARTMLLSQGGFNHPGYHLLLEW
jgi:hypothetical protein